tara:strand:- start:511 stop:648 length:138 start_codon:yes stop_codon:yes gene_type:complete
MSWEETRAEAFRRMCEKEAHIRKCYKLMKKAMIDDTISGDMMRDE